MALYQT